MTRQTIEEAVGRFNAALEALQLAIERRKATEDQIAQLEEDLHTMALDRAQLARRLDEALKKASGETQDTALKIELKTRIDRALQSVDHLIEQAEAA